MESLEERTNKVKDKEHLLLRLNQRHQPVSHQIKQAADLEMIAILSICVCFFVFVLFRQCQPE